MQGSIATLRNCIIQLSEIKEIDHSVLEEVECCEDVEKLKKLYTSLLKNEI